MLSRGSLKSDHYLTLSQVHTLWLQEDAAAILLPPQPTCINCHGNIVWASIIATCNACSRSKARTWHFNQRKWQLDGTSWQRYGSCSRREGYNGKKLFIGLSAPLDRRRSLPDFSCSVFMSWHDVANAVIPHPFALSLSFPPIFHPCSTPIWWFYHLFVLSLDDFFCSPTTFFC